MQLSQESSQTQTIVSSRSLCCNLLQQQMIYIYIIQKPQWPPSNSEIVRLKYQDSRIYMLMCINRKGTFHYSNTSILLISRQRMTLLTKSQMFWSKGCGCSKTTHEEWIDSSFLKPTDDQSIDVISLKVFICSEACKWAEGRSQIWLYTS
jgi:hypothetical protein